MLRRVGRISEIERSQRFEYLFLALPVAHHNGASALAVCRDYLRIDFVYLRRCRRYRFEQRLRVILHRERADKHRRRIRALALHRDIETQPRLERVHRGTASDIVRRVFAHIRFERVYPVALAEYFIRLIGFFNILRNLELLSAAERRHKALQQPLFLRSIFVERFLRALRRRKVPFKGRNGDARRQLAERFALFAVGQLDSTHTLKAVDYLLALLKRSEQLDALHFKLCQPDTS